MSDLKDFVIENGVLTKYVGAGGDVVIPDGVKSIAEDAFLGCSKLISITIPDSVVSIGCGAFCGFHSLVEITLPGTIKNLERSEGLMWPLTFTDCPNVKKVVVTGRFCSKSVASMFQNHSKYALNPKSLEMLQAPMLALDEITQAPFKRPAVIGFLEAISNGFSPVAKIANSYHKYISSQRKKLYSTIVPNVAYLRYLIDQRLIPFEDIDVCLKIATSEKNSESTTLLLEYENSFSDSERKEMETKSLKSANSNTDAALFKKQFTTQKEQDGTLTIVSYKSAEKKVCVPFIIGKSTVTKIGWGAFSPQKINRPAAQIPYCEKLTDVVVGEGIQVIERDAFKDCKKLKSVTLPNSLVEIVGSIFENCPSLATIEMGTDNPRYYVSDNILYDRAWYERGAFGLPDDNIRYKALLKCTCDVEVVSIPSDIKVICDKAFGSCKKLKSVILPHGVIKIGLFAFEDCTELEIVNIPKTLTAIDSMTFVNCKRLKSLFLPDTIINLARNAFWNCPNLTIHAPAGSYAEQYAKENNIPFVAE